MRNVLRPVYYNGFGCVGGECSDSCCTGWQISVDKDTYKKYGKLPICAIKNKLKGSIKRNSNCMCHNQYASMNLVKGVCPMLKADGLCSIHSELGEDYLSLTCKTYPRLVKRVNGGIEASLSLSCPEAVKLALLNPKGIEFVCDFDFSFNGGFDSSERYLSNSEDDWKDYSLEIRAFTIYVLQSREYTLDERLIVLGLFYEQLQEIVDNKNLGQISTLIEGFKGEMIQDNVKSLVSSLKGSLTDLVVLNSQLIKMRSKIETGSITFVKCFNEMYDGLTLKSDKSYEVVLKRYTEGINKYYGPFMEEHHYLLENYLVSVAFSRFNSLENKTPFEFYSLMIIRFISFKSFLIGMANHREELTTEMVVEFVQGFSKANEHSLVYYEQVKELLREMNLVSLEKLLSLLSC